MTTTKQAIPTDFMGVRFRSKSEAMFANVLEHLGNGWIYEPNFLTVGDYTPDFVFFTKKPNDLTKANIVEYKPCKPTQAYFDRIAEIAPKIISKLGNMPCGMAIISFNFFENSQLDAWSYMHGKWKPLPFRMWPDELLDSVKSYRYDLECIAVNPSCHPQQGAVNVAKTKTSEPDTSLSQFRAAISSIDDLLGDYAGMVCEVEINGEEWDVVFPPGYTKPKEVCEKIENTVRIKDAIFRRLGYSVNLKFSVMPSNLNKKFFEAKNEIKK